MFCAVFFNFCCHCSCCLVTLTLPPSFLESPDKPLWGCAGGNSSLGSGCARGGSGSRSGWLCPFPNPSPITGAGCAPLGVASGPGFVSLRLVPAFNQAAAAMTTRLAEGRRPSRPPRFYHFFLSILLCRWLRALPVEPRGPEGLATAPGSGCISPGSSGAGVWGLRTGWTPAGRQSVLKFLLSQGPGIFRKRRPPFVVLLAGRREGGGASALISFIFFSCKLLCGTRGLGLG